MATPKLSEPQKRVLKWLGRGWRAEQGSGTAVMVNGNRLCNVDTVNALKRMGYTENDNAGCWVATDLGKTVSRELGL